MSNRYKGAVISATPPTTTGGEEGTASGAWTLEQQMQLQAAGLWPAQPTGPYIEQVFSTYLYTGTGAAQTITNGINLSGKGGLIWTKSRTSAYWHTLFDTVRGNTKVLYSNSTSGQDTLTNTITSFNSTGYTLGVDSNGGNNASGDNFVSWTFREQAKFFDVVTYTGNGTARTVAHNLGSAPGSVIVKRTDSANDWIVWHRSGTQNNNDAAILNATDSYSTIGTGLWGAGGGTPDMNSSTISIGGNNNVNASGGTFVAYLFAHNAGGFGLTGTDNVISCGSYTGNGSTNGPTVTLGYEPQWLLVKNASSAFSWYIVDNMRGFPNGASLFPNDSSTESNALSGSIQINATGFTLTQNYAAINANGSTYIYIAIRRGPMAVPTVGTSVFATSTWSGSAGNKDLGSQTAGFGSGYLSMLKSRTSAQDWGQFDQLRSSNKFLSSTSTSSEVDDGAPGGISVVNNKLQLNTGSYFGAGGDGGGQNYIGLNFRRAPNFFDEVCYTGDGTAGQNFNHNLGVAPELIIVKGRNSTLSWAVQVPSLGSGNGLLLNLTNALFANGALWNSTAPTSSVFTVGTSTLTGNSGSTYVAYLFATCAGVSKVGSYTGTGAAQTINCGFTSGARFVLIKRTDSTGDWNVWDSARGIIPANDPYLALNSTGTEVTGTDYVDTTAVGFDITSTAPAAINANGGTFIFLAIA